MYLIYIITIILATITAVLSLQGVISLEKKWKRLLQLKEECKVYSPELLKEIDVVIDKFPTIIIPIATFLMCIILITYNIYLLDVYIN